MKIGLTFDLRSEKLAQGMSLEEAAEFDSEETIDALEAAIRSMGHDTERIGGIEKLAAALTGGRRWDMVFNIAEGVRGFGREAQVPALLEAWNIPCSFSDSLTLCLCLHKAMAKRVARDCGVATPDFALAESPDDASDVSLPFPLFCKPVAEGTSKGVTGRSLVHNRSELRAALAELIARFGQPVLVERFLPGREFTVGLTGQGKETRVLGVIEVKLLDDLENGAYGFESKERYEELVRYNLAEDQDARRAAETAVRAWRALGCRDAGRIDIRLDEAGTPAFIEANPLPGLNPVRSDLPILCGLAGIPYGRLIATIVEATLSRAGTLRRAA